MIKKKQQQINSSLQAKCHTIYLIYMPNSEYFAQPVRERKCIQISKTGSLGAKQRSTSARLGIKHTSKIITKTDAK